MLIKRQLFFTDLAINSLNKLLQIIKISIFRILRKRLTINKFLDKINHLSG